ncbi:antibiotic biosynthesis monooxygenase family protein [Streptomyces sp. NPDC056653]|uniref:antibiotic biosynthesis monooxygenase family protein n=1 Tax=Streptomyces sp. NPDC056653 TaxID=3345894 RepID=UPI0036AA0580
MSVFEVARIAVKGGMETSFSEGMKSGAAIIAEAPGCRSVQVMQGVEDARDFVLVVGWNSIDDHQAFRDSPRLAEYRATVSEFLDGPPSVSHFEVRVDIPAG